MEYNKHLLPYAKELRREMTPQERKLWFCFLSEHRPRFMRQKIIGGYIVDFYCAAAKLIIEVDGSQHHAPDNCVYDEVRTQALNDLNLDVIRINNADIDKDFEAVCLFISEQVTQYLNQPRNPRPPL